MMVLVFKQQDSNMFIQYNKILDLCPGDFPVKPHSSISADFIGTVLSAIDSSLKKL